MNYSIGAIEIDQFAHYFELQKHLMTLDEKRMAVDCCDLTESDELIMSFYADYNAIFYSKSDGVSLEDYEPLFFGKD